MRLDIAPVVQGLRTLNGNRLKGLSITEMGVCGHPQSQGQLAEEEYAPYVAASHATNTYYMRWNRVLMPPEGLHATVSVDQTVIAWIQYDGVVRVIDRKFSSPRMNTIRDLARDHLGQAPDVQQRLADLRADIGAMSANGFQSAIGEFRRRAAPGSQTNDYPPGVWAADWDHANRVRNTGRDKDIRPWIYPPNPTRALTDDERAHWRAEASRYRHAFQTRFPREFRSWEFRNWWVSTRESRAADAPLGLTADERIVVEYFDHIIPAVVAWPMRKNRNVETVDLVISPDHIYAGEDGYLSWVSLYPSSALRYADVPEDVRAGWDATWAELLKRVQEKFAGPMYDRLRFNR